MTTNIHTSPSFNVVPLRQGRVFPPLRSVGDDDTSYQGNQKHLVISIPSRARDDHPLVR